MRTGPDVMRVLNFGEQKRAQYGSVGCKIKGMSRYTDAIIKERTENGPYASVYDLMERVPAQAMNKKALECMALAGALDSFGIRREQYLEPMGNDTFIGTLSRYGQQYQTAKSEAHNSLFGDFDAIEITKPKPPIAQEWSAIERLNRERDLVGIYLSAHPLDEFSIVLECVCNTKCAEIGREANKEALAKRDVMTLGGIVTSVNSRFTKTGKPMGIVTIEDFEGQGELAFFGEDWGRWQGMLMEECSVYVKMKSQERFRGTGMYNINVQSVEYLQTVAEHSMTQFTIHIDLDTLSKENGTGTLADAADSKGANSTLTDLTTIIKESPGNTQLNFTIRESRISPQPVQLVSRLPGIKVNRRLVDFIRSHDSMHFSI